MTLTPINIALAEARLDQLRTAIKDAEEELLEARLNLILNKLEFLKLDKALRLQRIGESIQVTGTLN